jgi:hypothetical protein
MTFPFNSLSFYQLPAGSLRQFYQGVDLPGPLYRFLCRPRSQTLVTTDGLDLLWLHDRPRCDRLYPLRDPDPSPLASQVCARVVPRLRG